MIKLLKYKTQIFNIILLLVSVLLPFMRVAPIGIVLLIAVALINYKSFCWKKTSNRYALIIASPFICHLLFLWNESSFITAVKPIEKLLSLIIFPIIFLGYKSIISKEKLLKWYPIISIIVLIGLAIRFILTSSQKINNYLNGIDLHEPGYAFAKSFGSHGPAINMHISFIIIVLFYNLYRGFNKNDILFSLKKNVLSVVLFFIAIVLLVLVNTRLAILVTLINIILIFVFYNLNRLSIKQNIAIISLITLVFSAGVGVYIKINPAFKDKLTTITFAHMDKVGRLDEVENPEVNIFNSLVTRVSIWKTALELGERYKYTGVGASSSLDKLVEEYKNTNQRFLYKYKFPVHNQFIDYFLKFGVIGSLFVMLYVFNILYIGLTTKQVLAICFFILFFSVNLVDDFLIRFDGIGFSAFWISFFSFNTLKREEKS